MGHGSLAVVLLASIPGLMKFDLIYWWAGRLWGERVIHLFAGQSERQRRRAQKFVARVNRWGRWFTWPASSSRRSCRSRTRSSTRWPGWTGMSWVTFLILDAIGSLAWAGMLAGLGYALGQQRGRLLRRNVQVWAVGDRSPSSFLWWPDKCGVRGRNASCTCILNVQLALQVHALMRQDVYCVDHPDDAGRSSGSR